MARSHSLRVSSSAAASYCALARIFDSGATRPTRRKSSTAPPPSPAFGCAGQNAGAVRVLRKALREPDSGVHGALVPGVLVGAAQALLAFLVGDQRRVGGGRGLLVPRIAVGGVLVLGGGIRILMAFEQRLRQQVVGRGGVVVFRERLQVVAVPARGFL